MSEKPKVFSMLNDTTNSGRIYMPRPCLACSRKLPTYYKGNYCPACQDFEEAAKKEEKLPAAFEAGRLRGAFEHAMQLTAFDLDRENPPPRLEEWKEKKDG